MADRNKTSEKGWNQDPHRYDDMLHMEHHTSKNHPRMSLLNRAAQFSPFAALTGYEGQIKDAQHIRCNRILLSEEEKAPINACLSVLKKHDSVILTYFVEDPGTDGSGGMAEGEYQETAGEVLKIDPAYRTLRIGGREWWVEMAFDDILSIKKVMNNSGK